MSQITRILLDTDMITDMQMCENIKPSLSFTLFYWDPCHAVAANHVSMSHNRCGYVIDMRTPSAPTDYLYTIQSWELIW